MFQGSITFSSQTYEACKRDLLACTVFSLIEKEIKRCGGQYCFLTIDTLRELLEFSKPSIIRAVKTLKENGLIKADSDPTYKGKGIRHRYALGKDSLPKKNQLLSKDSLPENTQPNQIEQEKLQPVSNGLLSKDSLPQNIDLIKDNNNKIINTIFYGKDSLPENDPLLGKLSLPNNPQQPFATPENSNQVSDSLLSKDSLPESKNYLGKDSLPKSPKKTKCPQTQGNRPMSLEHALAGVKEWKNYILTNGLTGYDRFLSINEDLLIPCIKEIQVGLLRQSEDGETWINSKGKPVKNWGMELRSDLNAWDLKTLRTKQANQPVYKNNAQRTEEAGLRVAEKYGIHLQQEQQIIDGVAIVQSEVQQLALNDSDK